MLKFFENHPKEAFSIQILRDAGIAEETYQEMLYDPQIFSAFQKRKRKVLKLKYRIEGEDEPTNLFVEEILDKIDLNRLITGMLRAIPLGFALIITF